MAFVKYMQMDGRAVSQEWYSVLKAMRADGVAFHVNQGHRTIAEQWYFWNLYRSGRGNLAAYPSPFAPHVRTGRIDHAIDFGNDYAVFHWLQNHGLQPARTVRGESWHIECPAKLLRAFFLKHGPDPVIREGTINRHAVTRLQRLLRSLHYTGIVNGKYNIWTRRAVRKFQRKHHLPVDGVVGARTWQALRHATNK